VKALLRDPALRVVDGYYNENCAHSWLRHKNGWVLDVYAIERLPQVQVVDEQWHVKQSYVAKKRVFADVQAHEGGPKGYPRPSLAYVRRLVRATLENLRHGRDGSWRRSGPVAILSGPEKARTRRGGLRAEPVGVGGGVRSRRRSS
jgi:hypothetical protein